MEYKEMIERFVCPGCVCGSDTECGSADIEMDGGYAICKSHVVGTSMLGGQNFALGLPKGFCKAGLNGNGLDPYRDHNNQMLIRCFLNRETIGWNHLNVPVWAMEKDGFLFVRTYSPRIGQRAVDVIHGGTLDMCPSAIDVADFYNEID